jgi:predicted PurR-regulated permease PerM
VLTYSAASGIKQNGLSLKDVIMGLSVNEQARYWGIGLVVALVFLWLMGNVLLPFIAGMAIAYFLDPTADKLEAMGCSRAVSTVIITVIGVFAVLLLVVLLLPLLIEQTVDLVRAAPEYAAQLESYLTGRFPTLMDESSFLRTGIDKIGANIRERSGELANVILASAFSLVDVLVFMVVAPVVAFYMLLDWDRMVAQIDSWLPRDHVDTLRHLARELDRVLAGFVRGQLTVCGILGVFYAVSLMIVGLKFGLIVGLIAGLLTFIPYVGAVIGGVLAIGLALFQFWDTPVYIGIVAIIFVIGQMAEGNVLTPKLVGQSVGLHPVWLLFALSAFGAVMGFTGMLIAVPVAAMIGVFSRFGMETYLDGLLYKGANTRQAEIENEPKDV